MRWCAGFAKRPDRERIPVARERDRGAEVVIGPGVRSLHIGLLRPVAGGSLVDVYRAGLSSRLIRRAVDACAAAGFARRPYRERIAVAGESDRGAERVTGPRVRAFT